MSLFEVAAMNKSGISINIPLLSFKVPIADCVHMFSLDYEPASFFLIVRLLALLFFWGICLHLWNIAH